MSLESDIFDTLKSLVSNGNGTYRCYADVAPSGATRPYVVYQQVGGQAVNFQEGAVVGKRNARVQVACWAETRLAAAALARSAEDALLASALNPYVLGAMVAVYDHDTQLFGTLHDFSIWY